MPVGPLMRPTRTAVFSTVSGWGWLSDWDDELWLSVWEAFPPPQAANRPQHRASSTSTDRIFCMCFMVVSSIDILKYKRKQNQSAHRRAAHSTSRPPLQRFGAPRWADGMRACPRPMSRRVSGRRARLLSGVYRAFRPAESRMVIRRPCF